jgi:hypothetical protein
MSAIYKDMAYIRARLLNIDFFVHERRWDEALKEARNAIAGLKDIQEYVVERRNEAYECYDGVVSF